MIQSDFTKVHRFCYRSLRWSPCKSTVFVSYICCEIVLIWVPRDLADVESVTQSSSGAAGLGCERRGLRLHDDDIKLKHFPRYWPFMQGIHRSPVNSHHKGQWGGALMFSLNCAWINGWVNNRNAGDLSRHRAHYNVTVMGWHHPFRIGWLTPDSQRILGSGDRWEFQPFFKSPSVGALQADCVSVHRWWYIKIVGANCPQTAIILTDCVKKKWRHTLQLFIDVGTQSTLSDLHITLIRGGIFIAVDRLSTSTSHGRSTSLSNDVIMSSMVSQITGVPIVCSTVGSGAYQRSKLRPRAFVRGIHRWPVNSPHKRPVTQKMLPFDDVIMFHANPSQITEI